MPLAKLHPPLQNVRFWRTSATMSTGRTGRDYRQKPRQHACYLNKPEATKENGCRMVLRTVIWVFIDAEAISRSWTQEKHPYSRGENIACLDVEGALHTHPDVIRGLRFSVPIRVGPEVVGASVQTRDGKPLTQADMQAHLDGRRPKFQDTEKLCSKNVLGPVVPPTK